MEFNDQIYNQYYAGWGRKEAEADWNATGGSKAGGGGSSGGVDTVAQAAIPYNKPLAPINLESQAVYEAKALEELRPYYERLLAEENGDVERAKKRLEEDYSTGMRYSREDYAQTEKKALTDALKQKGYADEDANREADRLINDIDLGVGQQREDAAKEVTSLNQYTFPEEKNVLTEGLNRRGLMDAGTAPQVLAGKLDTRLGADQTKRQDTIELALRRYEETAGINKTQGLQDINTTQNRTNYTADTNKDRAIADAMQTLNRENYQTDITKNRGVEDQDTALARKQFELAEQKKVDATTLARQKRQDDYWTKDLERNNAYSVLYG